MNVNRTGKNSYALVYDAESPGSVFNKLCSTIWSTGTAEPLVLDPYWDQVQYLFRFEGQPGDPVVDSKGLVVPAMQDVELVQLTGFGNSSARIAANGHLTVPTAFSDPFTLEFQLYLAHWDQLEAGRYVIVEQSDGIDGWRLEIDEGLNTCLVALSSGVEAETLVGQFTSGRWSQFVVRQRNGQTYVSMDLVEHQIDVLSVSALSIGSTLDLHVDSLRHTLADRYGDTLVKQTRMFPVGFQPETDQWWSKTTFLGRFNGAEGSSDFSDSSSWNQVIELHDVGGTFRSVVGVTVTDAGSGYNAVPSVSVAPPTKPGQTATLTVEIGDSPIQTLTVVESGSGYTSVPNIVVEAPTGVAGTTAEVAVTLPDPAVLTGALDSIVLADVGTVGFLEAPTVTVSSPPSGTTASAHVVLDQDGYIQDIVLDDPGSGYVEAPTVTISDFDGVAVANMAYTGSGALAFELANAGSGYRVPPLITVDDSPHGQTATLQTEVTAEAGTITNCVIDNAGSGYETTPIVTVSGTATIAVSLSKPVVVDSSNALFDQSAKLVSGFLSIRANAMIGFPGDFTVEMAFDSPSDAKLISSGGFYDPAATTGIHWALERTGSSMVLKIRDPDGTTSHSMGTSLGWTRIALSRTGTDLHLLVQGVLQTTVAVSGAIDTTVDYGIDLGASRFDTVVPTTWIDSVRITRGACRYTSDYTLRQEPFPAIQTATDIEGQDPNDVRTHNWELFDDVSSTQKVFRCLGQNEQYKYVALKLTDGVIVQELYDDWDQATHVGQNMAYGSDAIDHGQAISPSMGTELRLFIHDNWFVLYQIGGTLTNREQEPNVYETAYFQVLESEMPYRSWRNEVLTLPNSTAMRVHLANYQRSSRDKTQIKVNGTTIAGAAYRGTKILELYDNEATFQYYKYYNSSGIGYNANILLESWFPEFDKDTDTSWVRRNSDTSRYNTRTKVLTVPGAQAMRVVMDAHLYSSDRVDVYDNRTNTFLFRRTGTETFRSEFFVPTDSIRLEHYNYYDHTGYLQARVEDSGITTMDAMTFNNSLAPTTDYTWHEYELEIPGAQEVMLVYSGVQYGNDQFDVLDQNGITVLDYRMADHNYRTLVVSGSKVTIRRYKHRYEYNTHYGIALLIPVNSLNRPESYGSNVGDSFTGIFDLRRAVDGITPCVWANGNNIAGFNEGSSDNQNASYKAMKSFSAPKWVGTDYECKYTCVTSMFNRSEHDRQIQGLLYGSGDGWEDGEYRTPLSAIMRIKNPWTDNPIVSPLFAIGSDYVRDRNLIAGEFMGLKIMTTGHGEIGDEVELLCDDNYNLDENGTPVKHFVAGDARKTRFLIPM